MKRVDLVDAVELLYPAISANPVVEELGNLRIDGKVLRASDGQAMAQTKLPKTTGLDCLVPAMPFYKLLKSLTEEKVELAQDGDEMTVQSGKAKATFKIQKVSGILDSLDFDIEKWNDVSEEMLKALQSCRFSTSQDAARGALCGVRFCGDQAISSDGYRITRIKLEGEKIEQAVHIRPDLVTAAAKHGGAVGGWAIKDGVFYFAVGKSTVLACKLLAGDFPMEEIEGALTQSEDTKNEVDFPIGIVGAAKRHAELQASKSTNDQKMIVSLKGSTLTLSSTSEGIGASLVEELGLQKTLKTPFSFAIHPGFFADILIRTKSMRYDAEQKFVVFEGDGLTHLMMVKLV